MELRQAGLPISIGPAGFAEHDRLVVLGGLIDELTLASQGDGDHFLFDTERLLETCFHVRSVNFVQRSDGVWRYWRAYGDEVPPDLLEMLSATGDDVGRSRTTVARFMLFSVLPDTLTLVVERIDGEDLAAAELEIAVRFIASLLNRSASKPGNRLRLDVTTAFKRVANTILKSKDLPEIFFNITQVAQSELSADICGIMLLEDDLLVMQRCVGNKSAATSSLKMRAGQGVGGRVLETGEACVVENYVKSANISHDFFDLARAENVRSALAVPLFSDQKIIGVLEVWRRRPSTFSAENTAELSALADLASVAIENAYLVAAQRAAVCELRDAHQTIQERYDIIERAANFQSELVDCVLQNEGLDRIAALASDHLAASVLILDHKLNVRGEANAKEFSPHDLERMRNELLKIPPQNMGQNDISIRADTQAVCQRVSAVTGPLGWVCVAGRPMGGERTRLALASTSITVALFRMKERAASSALSEKMSALLWDLIEAPDMVRQLALQRVRDAGIEIAVPVRLMLCSIEGPERAPKSTEREAQQEAQRRRLANEFIGNLQNAGSLLRLISLRGNEIVAVIASDAAGGARNFVHRFIADLEKAIPDARALTGISGKCADLMNLPEALREARLALTVARTNAPRAPVEYDDMGLFGLMLSLREGAGFRDFPRRILKSLSEPTQQAASLLQTLATYFETDCSQHGTAKTLRLHPKTVAYRLEKIETATGLSLKSHESRMLLSLALQIHRYAAQVTDR